MKLSEKYKLLRYYLETRGPATAADDDYTGLKQAFIELYDKGALLEEENEKLYNALEPLVLQEKELIMAHASRLIETDRAGRAIGEMIERLAKLARRRGKEKHD